MRDFDPPPSLAGDRFRIGRELARGGMASVWSGCDLVTNEPVAVKFLLPEVANSKSYARFRREIKYLARVRHPNVVSLLAEGVVEGLPYLVMPRAERGSLRLALCRDRSLPIDDVIPIVQDVAAGLQYIHDRGIVHRDVKPENILLDANRAMLADFGIARGLARDDDCLTTAEGMPIGTPQYMSPEQGVDATRVDGRTDLYALGRVIVEMLGGRVADDPHARITSLRVSRRAKRALRRALARDADRRFRTVHEFASGFVSATREDRPTAGSAWLRRFPRMGSGALSFVRNEFVGLTPTAGGGQAVDLRRRFGLLRRARTR